MKENSDQKIFDKIIQYAELKNKRVLEIGCGTGRISSFLFKETNLFIAIDTDVNAIKEAKTNLSEVDFRVESGEKLNFPDKFFDMIVFTLSLHHQNSQKALNEAVRVLKPKGNILVIEPVNEGEVEQVCTFIHNENNETILAQKSIINTRLSIVESEFFTAEWIFDNEDDLIQSLFEYYKLPVSSNTALKISNFLSEKIKTKPIVLEDKLIIQVLSVTSPPPTQQHDKPLL